MTDARARSLHEKIQSLLDAVLTVPGDVHAILAVLKSVYELPDSETKTHLLSEVHNLAMRFIKNNPNAYALFSFYAERDNWLMVDLLAISVAKEQLDTECQRELGKTMTYALEVKTDDALRAAAILLERGACPKQALVRPGVNESAHLYPLLLVLNLENPEERESWILRLLDAGADLNLKASDFQFFIDKFVISNRWTLLHIMTLYKITPDNLAYIVYCAIGCTDSFSKSVMFVALQQGANVHYVHEIRDTFPPTNEKRKKSLLYAAVERQDAAAIRLLLWFRADPVSAQSLVVSSAKYFTAYNEQVRLISAYHTARVACLVLNHKHEKGDHPFHALPQELVELVERFAYGRLFAQFKHNDVDEIKSLVEFSQARKTQPASTDYVADKNIGKKLIAHKAAVKMHQQKRDEENTASDLYATLCAFSKIYWALGYDNHVAGDEVFEKPPFKGDDDHPIEWHSGFLLYLNSVHDVIAANPDGKAFNAMELAVKHKENMSVANQELVDDIYSRSCRLGQTLYQPKLDPARTSFIRNVLSDPLTYSLQS